MVYNKDNYDQLQYHSLSYISNDNIHDTSSMYKVQSSLMTFLKQSHPNIDKVINTTDDWGGQYQNLLKKLTQSLLS